MLTNQQWTELVQNANAHEKEIGRSYYGAFINECSVLREKNQRLREENEKLKDENAGLEAAASSLYWDNMSLQEGE
jgi:cell shape-determining protein MreC